MQYSRNIGQSCRADNLFSCCRFICFSKVHKDLPAVFSTPRRTMDAHFYSAETHTEHIWRIDTFLTIICFSLLWLPAALYTTIFWERERESEQAKGWKLAVSKKKVLLVMGRPLLALFIKKKKLHSLKWLYKLCWCIMLNITGTSIMNHYSFYHYCRMCTWLM